ncbi:MAG TPA: CARDB domain-containing protein [Candidatus Bathyarchaeia archaeon]|nr:CARDB domain-containing protein [Candidatus Bathyarchaeia archaeon]
MKKTVSCILLAMLLTSMFIFAFNIEPIEAQRARAVTEKPLDFAIAINASTSKTVVGQGFSLNITVTVTNIGNNSETFTVAFYANTTAIATLTFTLPVGNSTTTTWNTAGFALGSYTMSFVLVGAPDGFNIAYGTVKVTIPGDIKGDGSVGGLDLHLLAMNWLETVPPAPSNVDIGGYGVVGGLDLHILAQHWLESV